MVIHDDHYELSECRNKLCDALKTLLNPETMGVADFTIARTRTQNALVILDVLIDADRKREG
jgi:hypothetical protein